MPAYLVSELGFTKSNGLLITLSGLALMLVLTPMWGLVADRVDRRWLGTMSALVLAIIVVPCFLFIGNGGGIVGAITGLLILTVVYSVPNAITLGAIFEVLKTRTRSTAFSIAWGLCVAIFGGAAPFISTGLISLTGNKQSPAILVIVACALTALGFLRFREPAKTVESA